jgi:hypothetical protein
LLERSAEGLPLDITTLVILLFLVAIIGYAVYHKLKRDSAEFSRIYRPVDENLLESSEDFEGEIAFSGEGRFKTQVFRLESGRCKLDYRFPEAVLVKVELFSASGDDSDVLVLKKGAGSLPFKVENTGRFFCVIEPAVEGAVWEIEIRRLGLPSQQPERD